MDDTRIRTRIEDISWRPIARVLIGVAILLAVLVMARTLSGLVQTMLVALFLAITADAAARYVQRFGLSRSWSLVIVIVGSIVGTVLIALLLVPPVLEQGAELVDAAPDIAHKFEQSDTWQTLSSKFSVEDDIVATVKDALVAVPGLIAALLVDLVGGIFGLVTVLIAVAFLLTGGGQALGLLLRLAPPLATAHGWRIVVGAYDNIGRYVIGATVQALCAGVSLAAVLLLLGVPNALSLGVFMLIMDYIPLVGATIGAVPAVAVALFIGGWSDGICVLVFVVVYQQVENTIIQPRIQGKVVNLPGIAIFFSVMVGSELLGILGALIAVPIASIVAILLHQYFDITDRPPVTLPRMFDDRGKPIGRTPVGADADAEPGLTI